MSMEELNKKIELWQNYAETLEKENYAKNGETSVLYEQLKSIQEENEMLKNFIEVMKDRWEEEKRMYASQAASNANQVLSSRDYGQELRNSVNMTSLKQVAQQMQKDLDLKDAEIAQLKLEKEDLERGLDTYKSELGQMTSRVMKSQEKLRKQLALIKSLEEEKFQMKRESLAASSHKPAMSFAKLQADKLVRQNNELIERIRVLQKEKNGYYTELKSTSPLKVRPSNKENNSLLGLSRQKSSTKGERWNMMEEKLRQIRSENERLRANLSIQ